MDSSPERTLKPDIFLLRKDIFFLVKNNLKDKLTVIKEIIESEISQRLQTAFRLSENSKLVIKTLINKFRQRWIQARRGEKRFLEKNNDWLNVEVFLSKKKAEAEPECHANMGRPSGTFQESSNRTKRRRTAAIREEYSSAELSFAAEMSLRASGHVNAAKVIKDVAQGSPSKASKYRSSIDLVQEIPKNGDEALTYMVEAELSRNQYVTTRNNAVKKNCKLYPPYRIVLEAKKKCYPAETGINVTETMAEINLQDLLDHTAYRIILAQSDVFSNLQHDAIKELYLCCKWGCEGTSGQSIYKQKFNDDDGKTTDSSIFFILLVPLQLYSVTHENNGKTIIWQNPRPSSTWYCRPIKIQFANETTELTKLEVQKIKDQEKNLIAFQAIVEGNIINVIYKLSFTMIDGKVVSSVTETTSAQRCYICLATSKHFNNIDDLLKRNIKEQNLEYGMSCLHAWIRFFECLLHLSYKLNIKKWQARNDAEKAAVKVRKASIQEGFKTVLGLNIDQPKQGFGSSNDENTARRFFQNAEIAALLTGIDLDLITRFHIILQAISSGFAVNVEKFKEFSVETARKFVALYPWYYMPTTVHKILIHGAVIADSLELPIGQLSEEAQEASNKNIKKYRQNFARKCSRIENLKDVLLRLLVTSDPYINSLRKLPKKKLRTLAPKAIELLLPPASAPPAVNELETDSENSDTDSRVGSF